MHHFPVNNRSMKCRTISFGAVLTGVALLAGCHTHNVPQKPRLQITQVPPAGPGGPIQMAYIEGRAIGALPSQQIVLYAHSRGLWWIQPFANQPFTKIQPDATWRNLSHLGVEYAALLVEPGYRPQAKVTDLPPEGNGVDALVTVLGRPNAQMVSKNVRFSGYDWAVETSDDDRGGEPNSYSPENVWTDARGYLHLRMGQTAEGWRCAEVTLTRSLGYGTYRFVVQDTAHLGPFAVLGLYTLDDLRTDSVRAELDVELSRWGIAASRNAQFVVQPFYIPENIARFDVPTGVMTHTFRWDPGRASFKTVRGAATSSGGDVVSEHVFTSGVPTPAKETVHMDLYDFHHSKDPSQQPAEVVIEKFAFLP
jgi:hypothetical protein